MPSLFPLTLSAVEEFYLAQEMQIILDLQFEGEIDRAAFDFGLTQALARHPLLSALLEHRPWRRPRWNHTTNVRPQVCWSAFDGDSVPVDLGVIDLSREPGIRFQIQTGGGRSRMMAVFHHTCCDALGALQFLADLFTGYVQHGAPADGRPVLRELEPERLLHRSRYSIHLPPGTTIGKFIAQAVKLGIRLLLKPGTPLAVPAAGSANTRRLPFHGSLTRILNDRALPGLRRLARRSRVTVNDLLIREMFYVLRDWNRRQAPGAPLRRLAQMIPLSMRNLNHDRIPATNVMAGWFCNRDVKELDDPEALLQSIHDEGVFLKNSRLPALLVMSLGLFHRIPGLVRWLSRRPSNFSSVVLSNVGDPWRAVWGDFPTTAAGEPIFGNIVLRDANAASPMPAGNRAGFTVWHTGETLRVAMRCDASVFSLDDAEVLLEMFCRRIVELVDVVDAGLQVRPAA